MDGQTDRLRRGQAHVPLTGFGVSLAREGSEHPGGGEPGARGRGRRGPCAEKGAGGGRTLTPPLSPTCLVLDELVGIQRRPGQPRVCGRLTRELQLCLSLSCEKKADRPAPFQVLWRHGGSRSSLGHAWLWPCLVLWQRWALCHPGWAQTLLCCPCLPGRDPRLGRAVSTGHGSLPESGYLSLCPVGRAGTAARKGAARAPVCILTSSLRVFILGKAHESWARQVGPGGRLPCRFHPLPLPQATPCSPAHWKELEALDHPRAGRVVPGDWGARLQLVFACP